MPKLICVDLDGTLLRSDLSVSKRTADALLACRREGHRAAVITGRSSRLAHLGLPDGLSLNDLFDAVSTLNGADIAVQDRLIHHHLIPAAALRLWYGRMRQAGHEPLMDVRYEGNYYANFDPKLIWKDAARPSHLLDMASWPHDTQRVVVILRPELTSVTAGDIQAAMAPGMQLVLMDQGTTSMLVSDKAGKGTALRSIAEHFGIPPADCVAFGDDVNDLAMFAQAGTAVAMGNAPPDVQAAAHAVAAGNDEDGVAQYLERVLPAWRST